jgi:hypothetical protein
MTRHGSPEQVVKQTEGRFEAVEDELYRALDYLKSWWPELHQNVHEAPGEELEELRSCVLRRQNSTLASQERIMLDTQVVLDCVNAEFQSGYGSS